MLALMERHARDEVEEAAAYLRIAQTEEEEAQQMFEDWMNNRWNE